MFGNTTGCIQKYIHRCITYKHIVNIPAVNSSGTEMVYLKLDGHIGETSIVREVYLHSLPGIISNIGALFP